MFRGLPSTHRRSVLADIAMRAENRLEYVVSSHCDPIIGTHTHTQNVSIEQHRQQLLKTSYTNNPSNIYAAGVGNRANAESNRRCENKLTVEFELELIRAIGVPSEDPSREGGLVNCGVNMCLCKVPRGDIDSNMVESNISTIATTSDLVNASATATYNGLGASQQVGSNLCGAPEFIGNVTKMNATMNKSHSDCWEFSNNDNKGLRGSGSHYGDSRCFIRCDCGDSVGDENCQFDTMQSPNTDSEFDMYLFIELVATYRMPTHSQSHSRSYAHSSNQYNELLSTQNAVYRPHMSSSPISNLMQSSTLRPFNPLTLSGTISNILNMTNKKMSILDKVKSSLSSMSPRTTQLLSHSIPAAAHTLYMDTNTKESSVRVGNTMKNTQLIGDDTLSPKQLSSDVVDMYVGWAMIPLSELVQHNYSNNMKKASSTMKVKLIGGTPFRKVGIDSRDIKRRVGMYNTLRRLAGVGKTSTELEIKIITQQASSSSTHNNHTGPTINQATSLSAYLPPFIIIPRKAVVIIAIYRKLLMDALRLVHDRPDRPLPQSRQARPVSDVVLSSFSLFLADLVAYRVLIDIGSEYEGLMEWTNKSIFQLTILDILQPSVMTAFQNLIMHMYRAYNCIGVQPSRSNLAVEPYDEMCSRERKLRQYFVSIISSSPSVSATTIVSTGHNSNSIHQYKSRQYGSLSRSIIESVAVLGKVKSSLSQTAITSVVLAPTVPLQSIIHLPFNTKELQWNKESSQINRAIFL